MLCIATEYEELMMHRVGTPERDDTMMRFMMSNLARCYERRWWICCSALSRTLTPDTDILGG